jgi:hypothetical protein
MPTLNPTKSPLVGVETTKRFLFLLNTRWGGNRAAMARDIGCSHAAISQVANGKRMAGSRLLKLAAAHPVVNQDWLFTGAGEPLLEPQSAIPTVGCHLPVVTTPLLGPPSQYKTFLTGLTFPVAGAWASDSRYWLELAFGHPVTTAEDSRVVDNDLWLIETDTRTFWQDHRRLRGRVGIVNIGSDADPFLELVRFRVDKKAKEPVLLATTFDESVVCAFKLGDGLALTEPRGRAIRFTDEARKPTARPKKLHRGPEDLVGVAVALVRTQP